MVISEETRKKMSLAKKGKPSPRLGVKLSKETRKKISKNHADVSGKNNPRWKGGRVKNTAGYVSIYSPDHPLCTNHGYVREHRLVMEKKIGRYLTRKELVHHKNGVVDDNKIENLEIMENKKHSQVHSKGNSYALGKRKHIKHFEKMKDLRKKGLTFREIEDHFAGDSLFISRETIRRYLEEDYL